jgi:ankyrin repeat protein
MVSGYAQSAAVPAKQPDSFHYSAKLRFGAQTLPPAEAKQRLGEALLRKDAPAVANLLHHMDNALLNEPIDAKGTTFLHVAVRSGQLDIVRSLLEKGVGPSISAASRGQRVNWNTPFHIAVLKGNVPMVEMLYEAAKQYGVDEQCFTTLGPNDMNALHLAAKSGQLPMVQWVLAHGGLPLINRDDLGGHPPLAEAILSGSVPIVEELLNRGATADGLCFQVAGDECNPNIYDSDTFLARKLQSVRAFLALPPQAQQQKANTMSPNSRLFLQKLQQLSPLERECLLDDINLSARDYVPPAVISDMFKLMLAHAEPNVRDQVVRNFHGFSADYRLYHYL